jgi:membrane associated rhomboid family serine protease
MAEFRPGGFQFLPPVIKNIIIINVLMVMLQFVLGKFGIDLADYLGLHYWQSPLFKWWQPLTHMFMHGTVYSVSATFEHIFFNMFALWMFGRVLEDEWGSKRFLIFYLICGLGAALCHMGVLTIQYNSLHASFLADPGNLGLRREIADFLHEPTVGASGAVFGVLLAFGYIYPNALLFLIFPPIPLRAKWVVAGYILIELYEAVKNSAGDNIAHVAHLGGALFAFILLKVWHVRRHTGYY